MVNKKAAAAASAAPCVRWAVRALLICTLAVVALAQTPAAQAATWLDQRFYDGPPQRAGAGQWKTRSANGRVSEQRRTKSKRRRIELSDSERDYGSRSKRRVRGTRVASLGNDVYDVSPPKRSITGGVSWVASSGCLAGSLRSVIYQVAANYGPVTVSSTCRSKRHNTRVGGAHRSHHLTGNAADFRVRGNVSATYAFLKSSGSVGGLKHYGGGLFHIDTGARRSW